MKVSWKRALVALASLLLPACASLATQAEQRGAGTVTQWTLIGDYYGHGTANWRSLAILHRAMHDALNAVRAVYGRWSAAADGEPEVAGANPEVALAAAAEEVLRLLHPDHQAETAAALATVLARYPKDAARAAGERLGRAIGHAAVERRAHDGFNRVRYFEGEDIPGRWRPTPSRWMTSRTNDSRPFLFADPSEVPFVPPPALGSPAYLQGLAEVRRLGALAGSGRTPAETSRAYFWAFQSSQRIPRQAE
jgi:hypothetical protein